MEREERRHLWIAFLHLLPFFRSLASNRMKTTEEIGGGNWMDMPFFLLLRLSRPDLIQKSVSCPVAHRFCVLSVWFWLLSTGFDLESQKSTARETAQFDQEIGFKFSTPTNMRKKKRWKDLATKTTILSSKGRQMVSSIATFLRHKQKSTGLS